MPVRYSLLTMIRDRAEPARGLEITASLECVVIEVPS